MGHCSRNPGAEMLTVPGIATLPSVSENALP
jgi:hypothetical protein